MGPAASWNLLKYNRIFVRKSNLKISGAVGAVLGAWLCVASLVFAGGSGDLVWNRYAEAKRQLQNGIHDLMVKTRPELADIAQTYRDMQLALTALRSAKFKYLMAIDAARIVRDKGVLAFTNFEWTKQDAEQFFKVASHQELQSQVEQLKARNNNNPRWPEVRKHFITLTQSPEYRKIMRAFLSEQNQVAATLKSLQ